MMADVDGWTSLGAKRVLEYAFRRTWDGGAAPSHFYIALVEEDGGAFDPDWETMAELTELSGNGYARFELDPNSTDFDALEKSDESDWAYIQIINSLFTASGGAMADIAGAVLIDDGVGEAAEVYYFWDVVNATVNDGAIYQLEDLEMKIDCVA